MSGLRERQKEERRARICDVAVALFNQQGFHGTRLEDIAAAANLSVPTVCKYFPSKQTILLELIRLADQDALKEASSLIDMDAELVDVMCQLEAIIIKQSLEVMSPALWREVLPLLIFSPEKSLPEAFRNMNHRLVKGIHEFLAELQRRGRLRADADIEFAAFMLNDYSHLQFSRLVANDELDMDKHRAEVRKMTTLILYGMAI